MMDQLCQGREHGPVPSRPGLQAEIDVRVVDGQTLLVEPANRVEDLPPDRQAGAGNR